MVADLAVHVAERVNAIVNRLNKTKVVREVDHEQERVDRIKAESAKRKAEALEKVRQGSPQDGDMERNPPENRKKQMRRLRGNEKLTKPRARTTRCLQTPTMTTRMNLKSVRLGQNSRKISCKRGVQGGLLNPLRRVTCIP